jgi:heme A synthase
VTEHRLALLTTFACFLLLLAGGLVHATGSGMACGPDWPLCKGEAFPRMEGGVLFEHGHRLIAATVTTLTVVLAAVLWRRRRTWIGIGAVALVIVQALLGALTVRWNLPMAVKTVHLAVSMAFFCLLILISFRSNPDYVRGEHGRLIGFAAIAVYLQILLGAFVRHTSSGLACANSIPLCQGRLWPDWGPAQLHMTHRYFAVIVATLVLTAAWRARKMQPAFAFAAVVLVVAQITLGLLSVTSFLGTWIVTAHLGTGALLLADMVALYLLPAQAPQAVPA